MLSTSLKIRGRKLRSFGEIMKILSKENLCDLAKADDLELQARSTDNLIEQLEGTSSETLPRRELHGLDEQLRSIRGSLKSEVVKKVDLQQYIKQEKLEEIWDNPDYNDDTCKRYQT